MRLIIPRRISEIVCMYVCMYVCTYVCMYPSRLGMPLFRARGANVGITFARVTLRNATGSSPPDLNTLHEIDSQVYALRFVSLRCRTALCITALSDDRRLRFVSLRCQTTADIYRQRSSISKLEAYSCYNSHVHRPTLSISLIHCARLYTAYTYL